MKRKLYHVKKQYLLLVAGIVWLIAGLNIVKIGLTVSDENWKLVSILLSVVVFCAFYFSVFYRLVKKHTLRINAYQGKVNIFYFFDIKSYCIMVFMMSFGIGLRHFHLVNPYFIKVFYTGLGSALIMAGLGFLANYMSKKI